jgi:outer membrane protein assembly factor BamE (lipoprotein component of BamABCDE complex)
MVKAKLTTIILCCICIIFIILTTITGCAKKEKIIQVVPGRSIAGVEIGMSEDQVISILGTPSSQFSKEDMGKFGGVYDVSPEGKYEKVP